MAPKKRGKDREESLKKIPSIAPTMAIAPSDYEHIFHEGTGTAKNAPEQSGRGEKSQKRDARSGRDRTGSARPANALPKMTVGGGLPKMPSNAPTMAIAPSDYEHIYHQGQDPKESPKEKSSKKKQHDEYQDEDEGGAGADTGAGTGVGVTPAPIRPLPPMPQVGPDQIMASPDGYTMLGRKQDPNRQGIPLPPHIVRANNQFSRAVLQRVARFLATKADPMYS